MALEHPAPLIVIAAPNGARLEKADHARVPLSPEELADEASALLDAGVSVLHLHVRDAEGHHTLDSGRYREAMAAIRDHVGDELILQVTTESVGRYDRHQQMALVRELQPEAVSLALRELCPGPEEEPEAGAFFRELHKSGCWPQFILYSADEVRRFDALRQADFFGHPNPFALFVLGRHAGPAGGSPAELQQYLDVIEQGAFPWAVCCFGPGEAEVVQRAAGNGGHIRIGFENNRTLPDGREARDNAELVRAELNGIRRSEASRRPLASADWIRETLAATQFTKNTKA